MYIILKYGKVLFENMYYVYNIKILNKIKYDIQQYYNIH